MHDLLDHAFAFYTPLLRTPSYNWFAVPGSAWVTLLQDIQPDRFYGSPYTDHTTGFANYLYGDGHVDLIPASQIKIWADADYNFAKPPN